MYLAPLSDAIIGSGNLYDEASRSHAPDDIAEVHFEEADSVSPIEIACCQRSWMIEVLIEFVAKAPSRMYEKRVTVGRGRRKENIPSQILSS